MTLRARAYLMLFAVSITIWTMLFYGVSGYGAQSTLDTEATASIH